MGYSSSKGYYIGYKLYPYSIVPVQRRGKNFLTV
jgi:hypothetical protein